MITAFSFVAGSHIDYASFSRLASTRAFHYKFGASGIHGERTEPRLRIFLADRKKKLPGYCFRILLTRGVNICSARNEVNIVAS